MPQATRNMGGVLVPISKGRVKEAMDGRPATWRRPNEDVLTMAREEETSIAVATDSRFGC